MPIFNKYIYGHRFLWVNDHEENYYSSEDIAKYLRWTPEKLAERLRFVDDSNWIDWDELNILISSLTLNQNASHLFQYDDYASDLSFLTTGGVKEMVEKEFYDDILKLMVSELFCLDDINFEPNGKVFNLSLANFEKPVTVASLKVAVNKHGCIYTSAGNMVSKVPSYVRLKSTNCVPVDWRRIYGFSKEVTLYDYSKTRWIGLKKSNTLLTHKSEPLLNHFTSVLEYATALATVNMNTINELVDLCKYCEKRQVVDCVRKIQTASCGMKEFLKVNVNINKPL
ncbi:ORF109 [Agrotis segetum granulovirus]|uniref:ORF109 n=1 Tax=Agrotis segetum granulosis virus TaxID=10464 RepID=Q6QXG9_GVAS|nr:hypothetical protein AsGV123 [Agrotis segetum granulovirus]AAS82629.1 ORF109 [Agrotis segetum granulovirus]AHN92159.1 hypothetical protein AsGV120 [Agrotis segetum granulovirus]AKN63397.1 hypothetical protein AsGV123 [Agrotis segetum granulovirus]